MRNTASSQEQKQHTHYHNILSTCSDANMHQLIIEIYLPSFITTANPVKIWLQQFTKVFSI